MRGTTMDNPSCEWIRGRLPLCMGAGDGLHDPGDDEGDLDVEDRRAIERHLAWCSGCREHRSELAGALGALAATAGALIVVPDAPSLWPALERRIAAREVRGDTAKARKRGPAAGSGPIWAILDDEGPLQSAWLHDTLREVAEAVGLGARPERSSRAGRDRSGRSPWVLGVSWRVVGVSLAASVLTLLVVVPVAWRLRAGAEARMHAFAVPVGPLVGPPAPSAAEVADRHAPVPEVQRDIDARELAQAEPIKPPADPTPRANAAAGGKSEASSRFVYDLEKGNPMPPDGRDAKPVY
jgi:Putative zinc-finger